MAKVTEVRLTLAAFIYGIELDLKLLINRYITPYHSDLRFLKDDAVTDKIKLRFQKDNPGVDIESNLDSAIEYLDFQEIIITIAKNRVFLVDEAEHYFQSIYPQLIEIAPIRNRVMHTRPLLGGDFATVYEFVNTLRQDAPINWVTTFETKNKIAHDPTYVLSLTIPFFEETNDSEVIHNLPIPDFDETGFIGRKKDVEDIKRLILSNKVVSIIGDGGIGKTALALKVAYDILDLKDKCPFELIIWTSAKTTMLTAKGIEEIHTNIKNYTGLIDRIAETLDNSKHNDLTAQKLVEILEYLSIFKTLLIIDNLETIQNEDVRNFIREAQMRCNIVVTSRIGLGELEFPRKLSGLTEAESANLIRQVARIRNSDTLLKLPQATLVEIASKLYFNPLALKWFVNTVESGISPNEVLNRKADLLNFCLSNVYEKLSPGAISILDTIRSARKNLNTAEIIYLSELQPIEVRKHLNELFTTTLISREIAGKSNLEEVTYFITDFARDFLSKNHPLPVTEVKRINARLKSLSKNVDHIDQLTEHNELGVNALSYRTANEKIAAQFLSEALAHSKRGDFGPALDRIDEARNIVPNYFETYRVGAFIKATAGDILGAEEDYKTGLEIEPNNPRLLYYYSQFLLFRLEDPDAAIGYIRKLYDIRPHNSYTGFLIARCLNRLHLYDESIAILETMMTRTLKAKDRRIAYTDLMGVLQNKALHKIRIENDFLGAFDIFKKIVSVFDDSIGEKNIDQRLIKGFCEALYLYISVIPTPSLSDHREYAKELLIKYNSEMNLSPIRNKILLKYFDRFQVLSIDGIKLTEEERISNNKRIRGKIDRSNFTHAQNFLFIETPKGRFYGNKYAFIDINSDEDWQNLQHGQLVDFEIGSNHLGECAIKIRLLNE